MRRRLLTVPAALAAALVLALPVNAATPVASWQMNEEPGSRTMVNDLGTGNGTIGSRVVVGNGVYKFPWIRPNTPPANPEHLVQVPSSTLLNPGTGTWAIEFRMRTTHSFGNVIQKGQAATPGGYWKFEQPNGKIACLFKGSAGRSTATSANVRVNDGAWHTVRCERTSSSVTMYIDGQFTSRNRNPTGNISNTRPMTIAGKLSCDQIEVTCDYFAGEIDYVKIER